MQDEARRSRRQALRHQFRNRVAGFVMAGTIQQPGRAEKTARVDAGPALGYRRDMSAEPPHIPGTMFRSQT